MNDAESLIARAVGEGGAALLRPHFDDLEVADGEAILTTGATSPYLYVVVEGVVAILGEGPVGRIEINTCGPEDWLGEVGFLDGGPSTATAVARGPARLLRIARSALLQLTDTEPRVASMLITYLCRQLGERITQSSSGILEHVSLGQVRVRHADQVRGWVLPMLRMVLGGRAP